MTELVCRKCGDKDYYLQYKGNAIGAYCASCGTWHKWIGKKELPTYQRGRAVHKEGVVITLKEQPNVQPSISPVAFKNQGDLGVATTEPDWVKQVEQEVEEELPFAPQPEKEVVNHKQNQSMEPSAYCPVCNGEPLEVVGDSKVDVMIFDGVLTITDKEGVDILGTYRLKACPSCGRKY